VGAHRLVDRQRITVPGADDTLAAFVATVEAGGPGGIAAARTLAARTIDWPAIRAEIVDSERAIILAEQPTGPILAARFLDPAVPTAIHSHGHSGAVLVVEGRQRYERFERTGDTTVRLESSHDLTVRDVAWWNDPPDDIHRQTGFGGGAIELLLVAGPPEDNGQHTQEPNHESELRAALIAGFLDGDTALLRPWYRDDVLVDVNAPDARFQLRGRADVMAIIEHEEFSKPDRRLTFLRATDTTDGLLLETELRFTEDGELRHCREAHNLRVRDGRVIEHVLWCTGISDADTARQVFETAEIERL
jgi:hypothetical protein